MFTLSAELKAKGALAEAAFAAWLDSSGVAYMYVEQSPFTVPAGLKGRIKRPDYLVGLPHIGLLAFDVKAKSVYRGKLVFELAEVERLACFARMFHLTLYFVCVDGDDAELHRWVPLAELARRPVEVRNRRRVVTYPAAEAHQARLALPFLDVLFQVTESAMSA
ncbi:hypothetical protein FJ936_30025 [Mesorhizobium sp. B2-4-13]|uniref:hypothetical protein n=1 Tax=Mesorhizobium sp. B2-4-13 TaxID=2589936 RepID=UPI00115005CD|nr:hypothetical protein [Mesorhizobium sp. B2-4-13]TPK79020.1 hypothetical protein FJ936_30025 [Mesorhizobium sp. B2-4-13]